MTKYDRVEPIKFDTPMSIEEAKEEVKREYAGEIEAGNVVDVQLLCGGRKALVKIAYRKTTEEAQKAVAFTIESVTVTPVDEETVKEIVETVKKVDNENLQEMTIFYHTNWYNQRKTYGQNFNRHCHSFRVYNTKDLVEAMKKIAEFNSAMPNDIYEIEFNWAGKVLFQWKKN